MRAARSWRIIGDRRVRFYGTLRECGVGVAAKGKPGRTPVGTHQNDERTEFEEDEVVVSLDEHDIRGGLNGVAGDPEGGEHQASFELEVRRHGVEHEVLDPGVDARLQRFFISEGHTYRVAKELREAVTSPGGTSAAALHELEGGRLRTVLSEAVWAAFRRTVELGDQLEASLEAGADGKPPSERRTGG